MNRELAQRDDFRAVRQATRGKFPLNAAWGIAVSIRRWACHRKWLEVLGQVLRNPRPLKTVREFMRGLVSLGGFLCRKSDGEPGWKTIWRGLDTLLVAIRGDRAAVKRYG